MIREHGLPAAYAASAAPKRVAIVALNPAAHDLAAALKDAVQARVDSALVSSGDAAAWFALCLDDETDKCITTMETKHHVDVVLRAWASHDGGLLSVTVDHISPGEHSMRTFQTSGANMSTGAISNLANQAVIRLMGPSAVHNPNELTDVPAASKPPAVATQPAPGVTQHASGTSGLRVASYVTAGVGVVALAVGIAEGAQAKSFNNKINNNTAAAQAGDAAAQQQIREDFKSSKTASTVADIALTAGGAAIVAGVVMFFLSPSEASSKATVGVSVVHGGPMLALSGTF